MTFLDLCAGIGGFSLGLEWAGMTCKGQVEIDGYCNRVLAKHWPHVPRWGDLKALDPVCLPAVDLVCGGYPCQPFSCAGKRKGADDDRHLWPYISQIVARLRPTWCLFENVVGHVTLGLDTVLSDLESEGYTTWTLLIPACGVDAAHRRNRVWILSHTDSFGCKGSLDQIVPPAAQQRGSPVRLAVSSAPRRRISGRYALPASRLCRGVNGVPNGLDRIRALGNAVDPFLVCEIGRCIMAAEEMK